MEAELNALEEKINQTVELCRRLRAENQQLRQQLAAATNENRQLADKVHEAKNRLESLLRQIPESPE